MKRIILILIIFSICLVSYSQRPRKQRTVLFRIWQSNLVIDFFTWTDEEHTLMEAYLAVKCKVHLFDNNREAVKRVYVYGINSNLQEIRNDSLYQALYIWIKVIADYALSQNKDTLRFELKSPFEFGMNDNDTFYLNDSYKIVADENHVVIGTNFGMSDQGKAYGGWKVFKMNKENIVKLRKRLLKYIDNHNINIIQ